MTTTSSRRSAASNLREWASNHPDSAVGMAVMIAFVIAALAFGGWGLSSLLTLDNAQATAAKELSAACGIQITKAQVRESGDGPSLVSIDREGKLYTYVVTSMPREIYVTAQGDDTVLCHTKAPR